MPVSRKEGVTVNGWRVALSNGTIDGYGALVALSRKLADPYTPGEA